MMEWISVEDMLPEDDGNYIVAEYWLAYDHLDVKQRAYAGEKYGWVYGNNEDEYFRGAAGYKLIAWMPLPKPPLGLINQQSEPDDEVGVWELDQWAKESE